MGWVLEGFGVGWGKEGERGKGGMMRTLSRGIMMEDLPLQPARPTIPTPQMFHPDHKFAPTLLHNINEIVAQHAKSTDTSDYQKQQTMPMNSISLARYFERMWEGWGIWCFSGLRKLDGG